MSPTVILQKRPTKSFALLLLILILGLTIRITLSPHPGYGSDIGVNGGWAQRTVEMGISEFYKTQGTDYLPVPIMMWAGAGHLYKFFVSPSYEILEPHYRIFIKIPAILTDLLTCLLLFFVVKKWKGKRSGLLAALIYALHPAVIYESAIWGQSDSIYTVFVVGLLLALVHKKAFLVGALTVLALLSKPQAVIFLPLILFALPLRMRYLVDVWNGVLSTALIVLFPLYMGGGLEKIINIYFNAIGAYTSVSLNALNLWWALLGGAAGKSDTEMFLGIMTYRSFGILLFGTLYALTLYSLRKKIRGNLARRENGEALFTAAALIAFGFFMLTTEMHERYMFPFLALGLPFAFQGIRPALLYTGISFAFFLTLLRVLPFSFIDRALFQQFPSLDIFIATLQSVFLVILIKMTLFHRKWTTEFVHDCRSVRNLLVRPKKGKTF